MFEVASVLSGCCVVKSSAYERNFIGLPELMVDVRRDLEKELLLGDAVVDFKCFKR